MNHTHEGCGAVRDRGRSPQDFYPLDVAQVQCRQSRVEGAAPWNVVHHEQERIELAKAPELWNGAGGTRVGTRSDDDAGAQAERLAEVPRAEIAKDVTVDHLDRRWHVVWRLRYPCRYYLDLLAECG